MKIPMLAYTVDTLPCIVHNDARWSGLGAIFNQR